MSGNDNFWLGLIATASALAGFTLASYSIFVTRIEIAAADEICRRYLFKEATSMYSLAFILFALAMFIAPSALGLALLVPSNGQSPPAIIAALEVLFAALALMMNRTQLKYGHKVTGYHKALEQETAKLKPSARQSHHWRKIRVQVHLVLAYMMIIISWVLIFANLHYLDRHLLQHVSPGVGSWLANFISAEIAAAMSVLVGLILVSWNFYLFVPDGLLFEVDQEMLLETRDNIRKSLASVDPLREWLRLRIRSIQDELGNAMHNHEAEKARILTERAHDYLQGKVTSAGQRDVKPLKDRAEYYHIPWLDFCIRQKFMTFGEIVLLMNGIDLFVRAVSSFEKRLKEMPEQLESLLPVSESK